MPCCHRSDCHREAGFACKQRVMEAVAKIRERDAELLKRLAKR